jgi:hypothetical protein
MLALDEFHYMVVPHWLGLSRLLVLVGAGGQAAGSASTVEHLKGVFHASPDYFAPKY